VSNWPDDPILVDPTRLEVASEHFMAWWYLDGLLHVVTGREMVSRIYGWENETDATKAVAEVPDVGATFGYVAGGAVTVWDGANRDDGVLLRAGRWFALPSGCRLHLHSSSRVVASQRLGFRGVRAFGGPIEPAGRLRYIDGCSDTVLSMPPVLGDPCLNHLHFPTGIEQTEHTHPSTRAGVVARGLGWCETPEGVSVLRPGLAFYIPTDGRHRFVTSWSEMDVIAYHPDSDWGPTDDEHPMVNRTWVGGRKVDLANAGHTAAKVVGR
jgi:hypothetical protein